MSEVKKRRAIRLAINGRTFYGQAYDNMLLVHFIRDELGLTGTHIGCDTGHCGACTIIMNGNAVKSCMLLAIEANGAHLMTVEGLAQNGKLHPIQDAFWENDALECGFCTPGMIMSAYALLRTNPKPTEEEIKKAMDGNLCRCTGYLNIIKAIQTASGNVGKEMKLESVSTKKEKWVGQGIKRKDSLSLIKGEGTYGADIKISDLHYVGIVRSHYAHARILKVDVEPAREIDGVVQIFTAQDVRKNIKPGSHMLPYPKPGSREWLEGVRALWRYPLASDKVHHVGEALAVVVCKDKYNVENAVEAVTVDYDPLPAVVDAEKALEPNAPIIYDELGDNIAYRYRFKDGVDEAFNNADRVIKGKFKQHRYTASPMETRSVTASYNSINGVLTVWEGTQRPHDLRLQLSNALGIPEAKIRIIVPATGGGFGIKTFGYDESFLVAYAAYKLGKPVRWEETRTEHFMATAHAREQVHHYEVAVKSDGTILALKDRIIIDSGAVNNLWASWRSTAFNLPGPYKIPSVDVEVHAAFTNKTKFGAYRAFGKIDADVAMERIIDHIARDLKLSPIEVRMMNLVKKNEFPYETATGAILDSGDYHLAIQKVLDLIGYKDVKQWQSRSRGEGKYVGFGLVMCLEPTGAGGGFYPGYDPVRLRVTPTGDVIVETGTCNHGQGHLTTLSQVLADELCISPHRVNVVEGDTMTCPQGSGVISSRFSVYTVSSAVIAARKAKEKILKIASYVLGVDVGALSLEDGVIISAKPEKRMTLEEVAQFAYFRGGDLPSEIDPGLEFLAYYRSPTIGKKGRKPGAVNSYATYPYAVHAATVEVDVETGVIKVLKYASVHDCGTIINPKVVDTQHIGGIVQGLGGALSEELIYNDDGQLLTTNFMDYLLPTISDVPKIEIDKIVTPSPFTPLGQKGGSETGNIGPPIVICQAVEDALSPFKVVLDETPLTMERIWSMIRGSHVAGK